MERVPMLAEGYEKLTADLQVLRQERPRIVDAIEEARSHGDLSENAEYHAAKERQGQIEAQIAEIEDRVTRAQIIDPSSTVTVAPNTILSPDRLAGSMICARVTRSSISAIWASICP